MVGLIPWFAPVEWASGPPCPLSCGHLPAERMPPGMAAWQAGGSLHKRAPTPALVFRPCLLVAAHVREKRRQTGRSAPLFDRRGRRSWKRRIGEVHLDAAGVLLQPLVVLPPPNRQEYIALNLTQRDIAHVFGAQQIVPVGLAYWFGYVALLQREHRRAERIRNVVLLVEGGKIAVFLPRSLVVGA